MEDVAVLEGAGFGFVGVADQIDRLGVVRRDEGPLHAGRETRAATTAQAGLLHLLGDVLGLHREGFFQILVSAVAQVAVDRRVPALAVHVLEDEPVFAGVRLLGVGDHAGNFRRSIGRETPQAKPNFLQNPSIFRPPDDGATHQNRPQRNIFRLFNLSDTWVVPPHP